MLARAGDSTSVAAGIAPLVLVGQIGERPADADLELLDENERRRLAAHELAHDAAAFAAGRALLRRAAGERLGRDPGNVRLVGPAGRRPSVAGDALGCSVAHAGDVVIVAVGSPSIGVDVEAIDDSISPSELADIARDVLGAPRDEVASIRQGMRPARAFFERWTLTEAVLKALGTGFAADPLEVELDLDDDRGPRLMAAPGLGIHAAQRWRLRLLDVEDGCVAALATDHGTAAPEIRRA